MLQCTSELCASEKRVKHFCTRAGLLGFWRILGRLLHLHNAMHIQHTTVRVLCAQDIRVSGAPGQLCLRPSGASCARLCGVLGLAVRRQGRQGCITSSMSY